MRLFLNLNSKPFFHKIAKTLNLNNFFPFANFDNLKKASCSSHSCASNAFGLDPIRTIFKELCIAENCLIFENGLSKKIEKGACVSCRARTRVRNHDADSDFERWRGYKKLIVMSCFFSRLIE